MEQWLKDFQVYLLNFGNIISKESAKYDKDLLYAGKFSVLKEIQGYIDRHPIMANTKEVTNNDIGDLL